MKKFCLCPVLKKSVQEFLRGASRKDLAPFSRIHDLVNVCLRVVYRTAKLKYAETWQFEESFEPIDYLAKYRYQIIAEELFDFDLATKCFEMSFL